MRWVYTRLDDEVIIAKILSFSPLALQFVKQNVDQWSDSPTCQDTFHSDLRIYQDAKRKGSNKPACKKTTTTPEFERDAELAENVKQLAHGFCQLCDKRAPFQTESGEWYLESHHIKWLSEGGFDTLENMVALCPNCHRKMHSQLFDKSIRGKDIEILEKRIFERSNKFDVPSMVAHDD